MFHTGLGHFEFTARINGRLRQVMDTNRITYGPQCEELERRWADLHGADYGVLFGSGTDALLITLLAYKKIRGWTSDSKIMLPATTFVATLNAVILAGLTPILVDVDNTLNIDVNKALKLANDRGVVGMIPVHLFGNRVDLLPFMDSPLVIIEDSCESALTTRLQGWAGCYSFYAAHHFVGGVGGIMITDDEEVRDLCRSIANHGRDTAYVSVDTEPTRAVRLARFRFDHVGYSSRMTEFQAALVNGQLDEPDYRSVVTTRQRIALSYYDHVNHGLFRVHYPTPHHSFMMYPIIIEGDLDPEKRDRICANLEANGVETRDAMPLITQPTYRGMFDLDDYPISAHAATNAFCIPCHQGMTKQDVNDVCRLLEGMEKNYG